MRGISDNKKGKQMKQNMTKREKAIEIVRLLEELKTCVNNHHDKIIMIFDKVFDKCDKFPKSEDKNENV